MTQPLTLLRPEEQRLRLSNVRKLMAEAHIDALLVTDYANLLYLTGRVFAGYIYVGAKKGDTIFFVRRPAGLEGDGMVQIRKPEDMAASIGMAAPATLGLELDLLSANMAKRLEAVFPGSEIADGTAILRRARAVKTRDEQQLLRLSGEIQEHVYRKIPSLFKSGMTDFELQVEIEHLLRKSGCLGLFRISGRSMEAHMGSVIAGENADNPTPYDFAMGGEGLDSSFPVGANGTLIKPGIAVMVDLCGNFSGYMTDMSRTFACKHIDDESLHAHNTSIAICRKIASVAVPGTKASDLYFLAVDMAREAGLADRFMGHRQQAGFIGHGVGIEINELPVIAPRSRDIIAEGNVIALEPKFVMPHSGAVGIENTYIATDRGLMCITNAPEELIILQH